MKIQILLFSILLLLITGCSARPPVKQTQTPGTATLPAAVTETPSSLLESAAPEAIATLSVENAAQVVSLGSVTVQDPASLSWEATSRRLAAYSAHNLSLVDWQGPQAKSLLQLPDPASILSVSASMMLAVVDPGDGSLQILDLNRSQGSQEVQPGGPFRGASLSPDGRWLAVALLDAPAAEIWDMQARQKVKNLSGFDSSVSSYTLSFSSSGNQLILLSRGTIQLVDFFSGMVGPAFTHEDAVAAFDLSSDGRMLAAASAGTTSTGEFQPAVYVWNAVSGGLLTTLPQEQPVTALAYSPDGRLLAVASGNEIVLWEPASQQPLKVLTGHTDLISALRFSPNGTLLASASADQTVRFWQVQAP